MNNLSKLIGAIDSDASKAYDDIHGAKTLDEAIRASADVVVFGVNAWINAKQAVQQLCDGRNAYDVDGLSRADFVKRAAKVYKRVGDANGVRNTLASWENRVRDALRAEGDRANKKTKRQATWTFKGQKVKKSEVRSLLEKKFGKLSDQDVKALAAMLKAITR